MRARRGTGDSKPCGILVEWTAPTFTSFSAPRGAPCLPRGGSSKGVMLDIPRIKAISLDLDDTLWPIWPTIERAEKVLHDWMGDNAPMAAALFSSPTALREIRDYMAANRPDLKHD